MIPPVEALSADPARNAAVSDAGAPPPLAGAVRVRRSGVLAGAILFAVLSLATAGVISGMNRSNGSHGLGGPELTVQPVKGKAVVAQAAIATPYGAEPGAPVTATPAGTPALVSPRVVSGTSPVLAPRTTAVEATGAPTVIAPVQTTTPLPALKSAPLRVPSQAASTAPDGTDGALGAAAGPRAQRGGCADARNATQAALCADPALAAQDRRVRRAAQRALDEADDPDAVAADQARFQQARDRAAARGDRDALQELYDRRLDELEPR